MSSASRPGYSLVELLIAVGLSAAIVLAAFTALRVAGQAATTARRLADENALIRAGMIRAHEELDWWTMLDDPEDATAQPLRAATGGQGLAFTPLAAVCPPRVAGGDPERERGWDAADPWSVHDPRGWYRGNPAEQDISDVRLGRYGAFANVDDDPAFATLTWSTPDPTDATLPPIAYATTYSAPAVPHTWLFNQMSSLLNALGYYGYCEYMPANSLFVFYRSWNGSGAWQTGGTALGGLPLELVSPGQGKFASWDGWSGYPRGLYLLTFLASFALPDADLGAVALQPTSRRYYITGYGLTWDASGSQYKQMIEDTETRRALLAPAPEHWPSVSVSVQRFVRFARFTQVARVRWTSPITGATAEMNFTGFSTTLRGARQQRRPGWDPLESTCRHASLSIL